MLTNQVQENLKEAEGCLRNALHWAAKNERPFVCSVITDLISRIESVQNTDKLLDKLDSHRPGSSGGFSTFFGE